MIYAAWYFCYKTRLSIMETKGVLTAVWKLHCPTINLEERNKVIEQMGEYDSLIQAYMIPYLTECLFGMDERKQMERLPDSPDKQRYIQSIKDIILNLSSVRKRQSLGNLIQQLDQIDYDSAVKYAAEYVKSVKTSTEGNAHYLQGDYFSQEIFLLSVLRCAAYENVNMVSDLVRGEVQIELIESALSGHFGQLSWNIATEIQLQCGVPVYEALRQFPENWQEQPDMVELIIPFLFPDNGSGSVEEMLEESYKLTQFKKYWIRQKNFQNGCWMKPDAEKEERIRLCVILWQNTLWNLAMDRNGDRCVELIKDYWETPNYDQGGIDSRLHLNAFQRIMLPEGVNIFKEEQVRRYMCSPWQERTERMWNKSSGKAVTAERAAEELFHEFRGFVCDSNGIKVFMAVCLLERVFRMLNKGTDDFFIRLLLHFGDLFSCYGARNTFQQITSPPSDKIRVSAWEPPIRAMGYWANDIIRRIGMGTINASVPSGIINHLQKRSPIINKCRNYNNNQLKYLYNSCAFWTAAYWAYESLSSTSISRNGVENTWIKNGRCSNAARLCRWIFKYLYKQAVNNRDALQLNVQAFDAEFTSGTSEGFPLWSKNMISGKASKVRFNQLILCRNLTYIEWCEVGNITRVKFGKDAYLIAHTMRISTLLESEYNAQGHNWISEWKNVVSDISYRFEFSRMARYIMIQMFTTVPGCRGNYEVLIDLLKIIIHMIQEFASLDSTYYIYRLAENLIALSERMGEETRKELRGLNAVELFQNIESSNIYKWEELFYYYLLEISDVSQIGSERYAGKQLAKYWGSKNVCKNHLRTELIEADKWNELTDRMWLQRDDGKFLVVRKALNVPEHRMAGIIAETHGRRDGTYDYVIYSEGGIKRFDRVPLQLKKGDIVEIKADKEMIESFRPAGWKSAQGERLEVRFEITANELEVQVMGTSFREQFCEASELFGLWNGDVSELFSHRHHLKGKTIAEYVEYRNGQWGWIPFANRYPEFLVKQIFVPSNLERKSVLTFLGETGEGTELLFSVSAGENYILMAENWTQDSWRKIEDELLSDKRKGIKVRIHLTSVNGFPYLELDKEKPFDYQNINWRDQFTDGQPLQIRCEDGKWIAESDVKSIRGKIPVYVKNRPSSYSENDRCNVQVMTEGWDELNQRKGWLQTEKVKNSVLNFAAVTYAELKRLIQIKAGDTFKLNKVQFARQKNGYYKAELDNGMSVFCAVESLSFSQGSIDSVFWKNRLCIVENVRSVRSYTEEHTRKAEPCNPAELQGRTGRYTGIVAEFTPIINIKSEYANHLSLNVFMDIDEEKKVINVPISAFMPSPQHLGDLIEAEYTAEGWIFKTQCRTVNVRALWQIEDHRGVKDIPIYGVPLGLTDISRIGGCMATQDTERPVLHLWNSEMDFQHMFSTQCGVRWGVGKVKKVERRYSDRRIFRWSYQTEIVALQNGDDFFIGEAKAGSFPEATKGWRVEAKIYRVCNWQGETFYDLRRCFIPPNSNQIHNQLSKEVDEERSIYYQEWLEEEGSYAVGQINGQLINADKVVLKELYVPVNISDTDVGREWTNEIPLEAKQRPLVLGHESEYSEENIRVKLKVRDGKYIASVNDVEAMLLDEKLIAHFDAVNGYTVKKNFYYAGRDSQGRLLFEWGYGYYFAANIEDVTDMQGGLIGEGLFFNDCIEFFIFQIDQNDKGHWKAMTIREKIRLGIEGQVWQDAERMIIQLLKVRVKREDGSLEIIEVSVADRQLQKSRKQNRGWHFAKIGNARLKKEGTGTFVPQIEEAQTETVFAYLNQQDYDKDSNCREFIYIPLDGSGRQSEVLENKILCLTAGIIESIDTQNRPYKIANDQKINFFLPGELPEECEKPHLVVSVMRRYFSLDESRLRVYARTNPKAYYGNKMLVMLKEAGRERNGIWSGSVLSTPFRSNASLTAWLMDQKQDIVTLGILKRNEMKRKCAEVAPGILFDITEFCEQMQFDNGAVAKLRLVDDKPFPEVILPGDMRYIPDNGRPAELLIMDGALKKYSQTVDMDEVTARKTKMAMGNHFTIAGFPQILIQNSELLDCMIRREIPRLGELYRDSYGKLHLRSAEHVRAGYLEISRESSRPIIRQISPCALSVYTSWSQITFMDGKPEKIIEHVQRGVWHYHDQFTAVYKEEERKIEIRRLPDGNNYKNILVFMDKNQCLRYLPEEFNKFGMSAREIVENGLPKGSEWYPVAGVTDVGLWIEIFPGKILELPKTYLYTGKEESSLDQLYMHAFAPGDEIRLNEEETVTGGHGKILLTGFKFGARSAFGRGRAFLPVQGAEQDNVCLGGGFWRMDYPIDIENDLLDRSGLVMIDQSNHLVCVKSAEQIAKGDCVFLTLDERGNFCIAGELPMKVELAYESNWGDVAWLYHALQQDRRRVFEIFEKYLPVTVIGKNEGSRKIYVAYKRQKYPEVDEQLILCCNCIGMVRYSDKRIVVLRSGGYLFYVEEEEFIEGVSNRIRELIVRYLSVKRTSFFMTKIYGKWRIGLDIEDDYDRMEIQMLYPIPEASGFLCRSRKTLSLWWMPLAYACRVQGVEIDKIWKVLSKNRNRTARLMEDRMLSFNHEQDCERRFRLLDVRSSKYRVIPKAEVGQDIGYYYLSELYPSGDLLMLRSENRQKCDQNDPVRVDILKKKEDSVIVVPKGQKRYNLNLPLWISQAYRDAYCYYHEEEGGYLDCAVFKEYIPERFEKYIEVMEQAGKAPDMGSVDYDIRKMQNIPETRLIYLYELLKQINDKSTISKTDVYREAYGVLREWLCQKGIYLACGFDDDERNRKPETLDFLPAIVAILFLSRINFYKEDEPGKELAMHLMRMLGYAAGSSLHQEILLRCWLLKENRSGIWKRLKRLSIGGESMNDKFQGIKPKAAKEFDGTLNETQYNNLLEITTGIAGRHVEDREAKIVAEALLYSIGAERDYTEFYRYLDNQNYACSILAPLGRILALQKDYNRDTDVLAKCTRTLEDALSNLRNQKQPLELLTDVPIPISAEQKTCAREKCEIVINLLDKKIRNESKQNRIKH